MIKVLDHGYVTLINSWGSDQSIIEAARMSTDGSFRGWDSDQKLLNYLYKNKHLTPFEMCGAIFEIQAPIFVFREWHRHRTQSYNEMSARYIQLPDINYHPSRDRLRDALKQTNNKQAQGVGPVSLEELDSWTESLYGYYEIIQQWYLSALEAGVPKELARIILPVGRYSKMRASANLRNWMQFLELRLDSHAQWEIRQYAEAVLAHLNLLFPRTMILFMDEREKKA